MTVTRGPDVQRDSRHRPRRDHDLDVVEPPTQTVDDRRRFASSWGGEGILTTTDPGYAKDWRKLIAVIVADPLLRPVFDEARHEAESRATVVPLDAALEREPAHRQTWMLI